MGWKLPLLIDKGESWKNLQMKMILEDIQLVLRDI
jgi:hypothetical protein